MVLRNAKKTSAKRVKHNKSPGRDLSKSSVRRTHSQNKKSSLDQLSRFFLRVHEIICYCVAAVRSVVSSMYFFFLVSPFLFFFFSPSIVGQSSRSNMSFCNPGQPKKINSGVAPKKRSSQPRRQTWYYDGGA